MYGMSLDTRGIRKGETLLVTLRLRSTPVIPMSELNKSIEQIRGHVMPLDGFLLRGFHEGSMTVTIVFGDTNKFWSSSKGTRDNGIVGVLLIRFIEQ